MSINTITATTLDGLAREARQSCSDGPVYNLVLTGVFPVSEISSAFISSYSKEANEWQAPERPSHLYINHGEFIHRFGDGVAFIERELETKRDSRRACLSLISMKDIIGSQDDPIPSFMILQFGFSPNDLRKLLVTAYFRALETSTFLPVNLAEIAERVQGLRARFPEVRSFELTILAFTAYSQSGFNCLRKADLDSASAPEIAIAVHARDLDKLRNWINSKLTVQESVIYTDGLRVLSEAVEICKDQYDPDFLYYLEVAYRHLCELREARKRTSSPGNLEDLTKSIRDNLEKAKEVLGRQSK